MKNKEIEELLKGMRDVSNTEGCSMNLDRYLVKLLLSYIEQLEEELKEEQEESYKQTEWLVKKQKKIEQLENNKDKAIKICDLYNKKYQKDPLGNQKVLFVINNVMNILKGDSK